MNGRKKKKEKKISPFRRHGFGRFSFIIFTFRGTMIHQWGSAILGQRRASTFGRQTSPSGKWALHTTERSFPWGWCRKDFLLNLPLKRNFSCPDQPVSTVEHSRPSLAQTQTCRIGKGKVIGKFWEAPEWFSWQDSWAFSHWILPLGFGFHL